MLFILLFFCARLSIMVKDSKKTDWLTQRLKAINKPKNALANYIGIPQQHVNGLAEGKYITPHRIEKISEFTDLDKSSLFEFYAGNIDEHQLLHPENFPERLPMKPRDISVVGFVQDRVIQDRETWDKGDFYSVYIPYDTAFFNKRVFAFEVRGNGFEPLYPDGSSIVCVSLEDYRNVMGALEADKKVVVTRERPDGVETLIYRYTWNENGRFLKAVTKGQSPKTIDWNRLPDLQMTVRAVIIGSYRTE